MNKQIEKKQEYTNLLSTIKIGPTTVKNRIFVSAHNVGLSHNGFPTDEEIEYRRILAEGGAGLQIIGATAVHSTGLSVSHALMGHDDRIIPGYKRLADAVHQEDGKILIQLAHFGALGNTTVSEKPLWSPSPVPSEIVREIPHEMTKEEIQEIVKAFGEAARRVREGGIDGIEINCAHGLLVHEFLSNYSNKRSDEYGGTLENRLRFLFEVIDAVSLGAGPDLIVGIRLSADEKVKHGINLQEAQVIAKKIEETNKIHYINVISGTNMDRIQRWAHWPGTPSENGLFVHLAKGIKETVALPVLTVGRITDPMHAERILEEKAADMVGMARAHIADPYFAQKIEEGKAEDIRPCVGANICINRNQKGLPIRCFHNPEAGRGLKMPKIIKTATPKKIIVIGGGPAGLEASRVAALRGHTVELFESQDKLGGQLLLWSGSPHMSELYKVIKWQEQQIVKLGVKVHLNTKFQKEDLENMEMDALIIATGSLPIQYNLIRLDINTINQSEQIKIFTPHDILEADITSLRKVVIWDKAEGEAGTQSIFSAAELLAENGCEVLMISPNFTVGEDLHPNLRTPLYQRLLSNNVTLIPNSEIIGVSEESVQIRNIFSNKTETFKEIDGLVASIGNKAENSLYLSIYKQFNEVYTIGDCVAPRTVESAMSEAAKLARSL